MPESRAPYGRRRVESLGGVPRDDASPPTYYGRPALKASEWRWLIITYLFVGGLAGAAQVIAAVVDLLGQRRDRPLVSIGRYLALVGALISPVLLVRDLHTPSRWYNMLRIFRGTSAMSIGSWTLVMFGTTSGLAGLGQLGADLRGMRSGRVLARWMGVPAAASGALLATYTGSLLASTSTPFWAVGYRLLPALFGISGMSTAIAMLSLVLERVHPVRPTQRRLQRLALLVSVCELAVTVRLDRLWHQRGLADPVDRSPLAAPYRIGVLGIGVLTPLCVYLAQLVSGRELRRLSQLAALAALVGGYTLRAVVILAGKRSVARPTDYFRTAQFDEADGLVGGVSNGGPG